MKQLHRSDFFAWSAFDEARNLDFHSFVWVRGEGSVLIDPLPMSMHDRAHLDALGGASFVVVTNADHTRAVRELAADLGASILAPAAERAQLGDALPVDRWLGEGHEVVPGMVAHALEGSKTPGELALHVGDTLIFGDLVRGHVGGRLNLLPATKLADRDAALASLTRLRALSFEAVLVGDGWPVFRDGAARFAELLEEEGA